MVGVGGRARGFLSERSPRGKALWMDLNHFFPQAPSLAHNKSLYPLSGQIAPFPCMGQADWKHVCHSSFLQANQETLGWWDFSCLSSMKPASQSSCAEAAGPAGERGCLSSLQTERKILLTTSLSRGFSRDLNQKCDSLDLAQQSQTPSSVLTKCVASGRRFRWDSRCICSGPTAD